MLSDEDVRAVEGGCAGILAGIFLFLLVAGSVVAASFYFLG